VPLADIAPSPSESAAGPVLIIGVAVLVLVGVVLLVRMARRRKD